MDNPTRGLALLDELAGILPEIPAEALPDVIGGLARVGALAQGRLVSLAAAPRVSDEERLIGIVEAASLLNTSASTLYKRADELAFTRRNGRRLRFSLTGLREHIRSDSGSGLIRPRTRPRK